MTGNNINVKKLTVLAIFIALAYLCLFMFRIKVSFLTLDFKDVFITLSGFVYGPVSALCISFIEAVLELVTVSDTGFWGAVMNFAGSAAFAVTASVIYKYNKTFSGAVIGLVSAIFSMTAIMIIMNLVITPIYTKTSVDVIVGMILPLLLPFNLIKSVLNAALVFVLYKPISQALKNINVLPKNGSSFGFNRRTVLGIIIALLIVAASAAAIFLLLGGQFEVVKK